jgi:hypothetical protein
VPNECRIIKEHPRFDGCCFCHDVPKCTLKETGKHQVEEWMMYKSSSSLFTKVKILQQLGWKLQDARTILEK